MTGDDDGVFDDRAGIAMTTDKIPEDEIKLKTAKLGHRTAKLGSVTATIALGGALLALVGRFIAWSKPVAAPGASLAPTPTVNNVTRVAPKRPAPNVAAAPDDAFNEAAEASAIDEIKSPPLTPKAHFRSELREVLAGFQSDWDLAQQHGPNTQSMSDAAETLASGLKSLRYHAPSTLSVAELATLSAAIATCATVREPLSQSQLGKVQTDVTSMVRSLQALSTTDEVAKVRPSRP
jgi:hypothetical protein